MSVSNIKWSCTQCTLEQSAYNHQCEICGETNKDVIRPPHTHHAYFMNHSTVIPPNKYKTKTRFPAMIAKQKQLRHYDEKDIWDHYYMDLVFKGFIVRWSVNETGQRNGGYININGEDPSRQIPFRITNINNLECLTKYYGDNMEINIPIQCRIAIHDDGHYNGEQYAKNIMIEASYPAANANNNNNNNNNNSAELLRGVIKMIPTHSVNGIIFCAALNEAMRFKYEFNKIFILDQEVHFHYKRAYDYDRYDTKRIVNIRHMATEVSATTSMSSAEIRRICLTKMGESHINSAYLVQNTEINIREDRFYEFKHFSSYKMDLNYGNGVKQMVAVMIKNMNAFMNAKGGVIFVGITDKGRVKGIPHITRYVEDKIRISISHSMRSWQPNMMQLRRAYHMEFVGVIRMQRKNNGATGYVLPNTKVIMVTVKPMFSSFNKSHRNQHDAWQRKDKQIIFRTQVSIHRDVMKAFIRNDASVSEHKSVGFQYYDYQKDCVYVMSDDELEFNVRNQRKINGNGGNMKCTEEEEEKEERNDDNKCDTFDINDLFDALPAALAMQPNINGNETVANDDTKQKQQKEEREEEANKIEENESSKKESDRECESGTDMELDDGSESDID